MAILIVAGSLLAFRGSSRAYLAFGTGCHFPLNSAVETYKNHTGGSTIWWLGNAWGGASAWNSSVVHDGPRLEATTAANYSVGIKTFFANSGYYGGVIALFNEDQLSHLGGISCNGGSWTTPAIWFNTNYGGSWAYNKRKANGAHEWGHAFGLRDLDAVGCGSKNGIMQGGAWVYENCGWYVPQSDDVAGVNAIYP